MSKGKNEQSLPSDEEVASWLASFHGGVVGEFEALKGGFWSSAYGYSVGDRQLVFRLSNRGEGFAIDKAAMRFNRPKLPVPAVYDRGEAWGFHYAVSKRHFGRFVEKGNAHETDKIGEALSGLLAAMRSVETSKEESVVWYDADESERVSWRNWLAGALIDNPSAHVSGWRKVLAERPEIDRLFKECESRIHDLLPSCPERRDLVHGDLLHQNVLVDEEDASRVNAVFSWKCSAYGDFLYDVAWCTFWSPWHEGISADSIWARTMDAPDLIDDDLADASLRHHCYELQIGTAHLAWNAWTGEMEELERLAGTLRETIERGPR